MKIINYNGKVIQFYDSIDEMPIVNFQKYNKYLLIDSGIGSDADDIDAHIARIARYVKAKDTDKALKELQNMRQNIYMVSNEISPQHMAFAALVHSVNGRRVTDLSDGGLKSLLEEINMVRHSSIQKWMEELKKNMDMELETYFPGNFTGPREKEAYDKIKARTLLVLDAIINRTDNTKQIEAMDEALAAMYSPKCFSGSGSVEIAHDKQFENLCFIIAQKAGLDARTMTVLQFYNIVENIKAQVDAEAKAYSKHKHKR